MAKPTVLVTGVSRGIGRAVAERCLRQGWRVIGVSRQPAADLDIEHESVDLAGDDARERLAAIARKLRPQRLVANAGVVEPDSLETASAEVLRRTFRVNIEAVLWSMQAVVPAMRETGFGRIVVIGSRAALGKAGRIAYGGSKAGIAGIARSAAIELAADGITVNVVAPGPVETELFAANHAPGSPARQRIEAEVPVRRLGTPEEIAAAVAYFLDDDAGFTTGQTLYVCGGLTIGAVG
jgi:3-oxoacyl-[acyl-carrier protein] reductase